MTNQRVLLIDDEYRIRQVTKMTIEMTAGWEVLTADSGATGLAIAQSQRPDAILLDMMMPGMDGTETLARLRANQETRGIPVILLTAKMHPLSSQELENLGVIAVIDKPFDPLQLAQQIAAPLGWMVESNP